MLCSCVEKPPYCTISIIYTFMCWPIPQMETKRMNRCDKSADFMTEVDYVELSNAMLIC